MIYFATITQDIPATPTVVFAELTNLSNYPLWNSGMESISATGVMQEGMSYQTKSIVMGRPITARIQVVRVQADQEIELVNDSGAITFRAQFKLTKVGRNQTKLTCLLQFELKGIALNLAHTAIESMAKTRLKGDFGTLSILIAGKQD